MNLTNNNNSIVRPIIDLRRPRGERPVISFEKATVVGSDGVNWFWELVCPNIWAVKVGDHTVGVIIHDQDLRWRPFFNGGERPSCATFAEALQTLQFSWAV